MGAVFLHGQNGGGSDLVFRVYACTALPATAKENDVAIITSTPINIWEVFPVIPSWDNNEGHVYLTSTNPTSGVYPNVNVIKTNKTGGLIWVQLIGCYQRESGKWVSKDAYQYRGGQWVKFSSVFSATMNITYPAGSTCTATNGVTTITAPNTSGTWACIVPNAGDWTITITNGYATRSKNVSITTNGQSVSVSLGYTEYVIKNGVIDMTAHPATVTENYGDGLKATNGVTYNNKPALEMSGRNGVYCTHSFANVAVPAWATVFYVEIYRIPAYDGNPSINIGGASVTIDRGSDDRIIDKTVSIDVSSISGNTGNLMFRFQGSAYNKSCYIGNAWFE